jgi:hypothetical protein
LTEHLQDFDLGAVDLFLYRGRYLRSDGALQRSKVNRDVRGDLIGVVNRSHCFRRLDQLIQASFGGSNQD